MGKEQKDWSHPLVPIIQTASGFRLPADEEHRLREALFALNRAIQPDGEGDVFDRLRRVRDEVWSLGVDLYGWTE